MTGQNSPLMSGARQPVVPLFEKPTGDRPGTRRLLLLTYHFPPGDATGALRWQKLCVLGWDYGWNLDVITLDPAGLRKVDFARLEELPPGTRVYGANPAASFSERVEKAVWSLYRWSKMKLSRRKDKPSSTPRATSSPAPMRPPDESGSINTSGITWESILRSPRSGCRRLVFSWIEHTRQASWARAARIKALQLPSDREYAAVVTCGPPHMVHEAGRVVAVKRCIPLVIDMRDPWSLVQRVPEALGSPLWISLASYYEKKAMKAAVLVVTNTEPHRRALQKRYPQCASRIITVMNGYDDEALPESRHTGKFVIAYAGGIYLDRDPRNLFSAVGRVVKELMLNPDDLIVELMGDVESYAGVPTIELARRVGIEPYVKLSKSQPRQAALEFIARATMLVNLPQDSDMAIPSKIFEYMQFDAWLLAIAEPGSAVDLLLRESGADLVRADDVEGMVSILRRRYEEFRKGVRPGKLASNRLFSRQEQARILFEAIESSCKDEQGRYGA